MVHICPQTNPLQHGRRAEIRPRPEAAPDLDGLLAMDSSGRGEAPASKTPTKPWDSMSVVRVRFGNALRTPETRTWPFVSSVICKSHSSPVLAELLRGFGSQRFYHCDVCQQVRWQIMPLPYVLWTVV